MHEDAVAAADQLDLFGDADAFDPVELLGQAARVEVAGVGIELPNQAAEEGLTEPRFLWPTAVAGIRLGIIDKLFENWPLLARLIRGGGEVVDGVELADDRADAVAEEARVFVRAVLPRGDVVLPEKALDFFAGDLEQRPDEAVLTQGVNAAKAGDAAAGEKAHQDRLGLVVFLMGGGDEGVAGELAKARVTDLASGGLDAAIADRGLIESAIGHGQLDAVRLAQLADKLFIRLGFRAAEVVIHVRRGDFETVFAQLGEGEQQRGRVDAARDGSDDPARPDAVFHAKLTHRRDDHFTQQRSLTGMYGQKRNRGSGFSVLELLVVGAIIAIIASISIYSYMNALNRAKQKRTVNDIRVIAQAWEARASDTNSYSVAGADAYSFPTTTVGYDQLITALRPTYLRDIPRVDGWLRPLQFAVEPGTAGSPGGYAIRSAGRDGTYATEYEHGVTTDPDCDIVWANGGFVTYPDVVQGGD